MASIKPMITATGRTFEHRDTIRSLGGWWSGADKAWKFERLTPTQMARLRGCVGVIVVETNDEPVVSIGAMSREEFDEHLATVIAERAAPVRRSNHGSSTIFGNDPTYHNHFADQNATAYFGFDSLTAFVEYLDDLPLSFRSDQRRKGWELDNADWLGTASMQQAIDLARNGWSDGLERASGIVERLSLANPRVRRRRASVAGGSVSVGRMLAGDPSHMIHRPKSPGRKVITFFVEAGVSGLIAPECLADRAALIGAMIDLMENVGYSCIVVAIDTSVFQGRPIYQLAVKLKDAGERLNLSDMIFALGHPSFARRLSFAAQTSVDETRVSWSTLGNPSNSFDDEHPCGPSEFYVPVLDFSLTDDPLDMLDYVIPENLPVTIARNQ